MKYYFKADSVTVESTDEGVSVIIEAVGLR